MNVLVACEESQEVCKAFRARGHNAFSCDIQECSGGHPEWHIKGDCLKLLHPKYLLDGSPFFDFNTQDGAPRRVYGYWDWIIVFPPCTYMTAAGACRMYPKKGVIDPERYKKAMDAKEFFMVFYNITECPVIIENPRPLKCVGLPREDQHIQPYQFGEPYSKLTYLWYRNTDFRVEPTKIMQEHTPFIPSGTSRKDKTKYGAPGCGKSAKNRAKTFPGVANALADQIGGPLATHYFVHYIWNGITNCCDEFDTKEEAIRYAQSLEEDPANGCIKIFEVRELREWKNGARF